MASGQVFAVLGGFASVKLLTNALGPKGYGELAFGMTIAGLFQMFVYGPMGQVIGRFLSVYREQEKLPVFFALIRGAHARLVALLLGVVVIAGVCVRRGEGTQWALVVVFGCLYGIASGVNISFSSFQMVIRQRKIVALHQGADNWLRPLLALTFVYLIRNTG
ncbi:MAG TPA: hypothetical protein VFM10_11045, partial [Terriglobales bacterium]|nr:hypothetical protein [Terriglobales bacterium]